MEAAARMETVLEAALRVREAARRGTYEAGSAHAVLSALSEVVDCDHASLARWDPANRRHVSLANNYPERAREHLSSGLHEDPLFALVRRPGGLLWLHDVPEDLRAASTTIRDVLEPSGFEDGVTQCLFSPDGRYVGVLNLSMRRRRQRLRPTDLVLALLGDCLAAAVDVLAPAGSVGLPADSPADTWTLAVPDPPRAAPLPLSGRVPAWLGDAVPLGDVVRRAAARRTLPATILVPHGQRLLELRLTRRGTATLAVCRRVTPPGGLSPRELDVLAELTTGLTNREIAERLFVSVRTVATHVEHILAKLDLPNRVAAASRATAWGLEPKPPPPADPVAAAPRAALRQVTPLGS
ncbi:response regulator transcription factor [Streptomyces sp. NPDC001292]|uniref:response regulator transcription factor n=1 Tax=Streptomyces sp. NPDC001292 TaxID=3364558 RepID=UPI0036950F5C